MAVLAAVARELIRCEGIMDRTVSLKAATNSNSRHEERFDKKPVLFEFNWANYL